MSRLIPPDIELPATAPGDPRVGRLLGSALGEQDWLDAVIVGFPFIRDVVELNPRVDVGDQTARLAALTGWWLLRGRVGAG